MKIDTHIRISRQNCTADFADGSTSLAILPTSYPLTWSVGVCLLLKNLFTVPSIVRLSGDSSDASLNSPVFPVNIRGRCDTFSLRVCDSHSLSWKRATCKTWLTRPAWIYHTNFSFLIKKPCYWPHYAAAAWLICFQGSPVCCLGCAESAPTSFGL